MCQTPQQELRIIELLILYIAKILLLVPSVSWPGLKQHSSRLRCEQIFKLQPQLQERTCSFRISLHIHSISRTSARTDLVCFCVPLYCIVLYCIVLYYTPRGQKSPPNPIQPPFGLPSILSSEKRVLLYFRPLREISIQQQGERLRTCVLFPYPESPVYSSAITAPLPPLPQIMLSCRLCCSVSYAPDNAVSPSLSVRDQRPKVKSIEESERRIGGLWLTRGAKIHLPPQPKITAHRLRIPQLAVHSHHSRRYDSPGSRSTCRKKEKNLVSPTKSNAALLLVGRKEEIGRK